MAMTIGQRWKELSPAEHQHYRDLAEADSSRYRKEKVAHLLQTEQATKNDRPLLQPNHEAAWMGSPGSRSTLVAEANGEDLTRASAPFTKLARAVIAESATEPSNWPLAETAGPRIDVRGQT